MERLGIIITFHRKRQAPGLTVRPGLPFGRLGLLGLLSLLGLFGASLVFAGPAWAHDPEGDLRTDRLLVLEGGGSSLEITVETKWGRLPSAGLLKAADQDSNGKIDEAEKSGLTKRLAADLKNCLTITGPDGGANTAAWQVSLRLGSDRVGPFGLFAKAETKIQEARTGTWRIRSRCRLPAAGFTQIQLRPSRNRHFEGAHLEPSAEKKGELWVLPKGTQDWSLTVRLQAGGAKAAPKTSLDKRSSKSSTGRLERMVSGSLSWTEALLALLVAFLLGAYHALSPGHGKTLTAAYLVGEEAGVGQAVALAAIVTFTHTFSIALLALGVLLVFGEQVPPWLLPYLGAGAGAVIVAVGLHMVWRGADHHGHHHHHHNGHDHDHNHQHRDDANHDHEHHHHDQHASHDRDHHHHDDQGHEHDHDHHHHHHDVPQQDGKEASLWRLLTVGISGGIVPCPTALVVLLASLAIGKTLFGLALVAAFSLGLATVLAVIGVLVVRARTWLSRRVPSRNWTKILPRASGLVITMVGLALVVQALR